MPFTTFFTFAKKTSTKQSAKAKLTLDDVLNMSQPVHVQMRLDSKGELVPHVVEHVKVVDFKLSPSPSSLSTLVGSPTLAAPSFVSGVKEVTVLPKADVSRRAPLLAAFNDATSDAPAKGEHLISRINVVRPVCSGNFGQVFLVQDANTRKLAALKVIAKARLDVKQYSLILEEQDILKRLAWNPEFLTLLASFEDKDNFYLLTEFYSGGDLFDKLEQQGRIPEQESRTIAAHLVLAFRKLREKRVIHRDVKPENILLDEFGRPVVVDFGLARQFGRTAEEQPWRLEQQWAHGEAEDEAAHRVGTDHARALVGTSRYIAPEQWKGEAYSYSVDVWAFGIMLYYMMLGEFPFGLDHAKDDEAIAEAVLTRELVIEDGVLSSDAEDLLHTILVKDPLRRPTWEQLKEHPWFDSLDWDALNVQPRNLDTPSGDLTQASQPGPPQFFAESYPSGEEPHPYFEWYGPEFETHIPEWTSDMSIATLPSSPSFKWLPEPPSTETASSLPPLQPSPERSHQLVDAAPLAAHASMSCVVEYETGSDSEATTEPSAQKCNSRAAGDEDDSWSSAADDSDHEDDIPLHTLVAQHNGHQLVDAPPLATHASFSCVVEYASADGTTKLGSHGTSKHHDAQHTDDHEDSWSLATDGSDDRDEIPLRTLVAQHNEKTPSSMSSTLASLASSMSTSTTFVPADDYDDDNDDEPDFDMVTICPASPALPASPGQWRSTFGAPGDAIASPARDAHSTYESSCSEDSTCSSPTDPNDFKVAKVHSSDTPPHLTSSPGDRVAHVALKLSSPVVSSSSGESRSCTSRSLSSTGSQSSQSAVSSVASSSFTAVAHVDATPVRRGWLEKLKSWWSWLGASRCSSWSRGYGRCGG